MDEGAISMNEMQLYFLDMYVEDDYGWFAAYNCNGLFRINFTTDKVECMGIFPVKADDAKFMYNGIVSYSNQLIFIPDMSDNIGIYDREKEKLMCMGIPLKITDKKSFCFSVLYENNLMLFQSNSTLIIKYDIETQHFSRVEINGLEKTEFCFVSRFFVQYKEERVFTNIKDKNAILEINLRKNDYRVHKIGEDGDIFYSMCQQDKNIWLSEARSGKLVKYDIENESFQEYAGLPDGYKCIEKQKFIVSYLFSIDDWIYIVSSTANMMLKFNIITELYEIVEVYDDLKRKEFPFYVDLNHWVLSCKCADKKIYSLRAGDLQLSIYDTENGCKRRKLQIVTDKKIYMQQYYRLFPHKIMLMEDADDLKLKEYLLIVQSIQNNAVRCKETLEVSEQK